MQNHAQTLRKQDLYGLIDTLSLVDARRFRRRLSRARSARSLQAIREDMEVAFLKLNRRLDALPRALNYPKELPIVARHDHLVQTIRDHQVVIIAGETGSGKTTQLPKICLEIGRGRRGLIGHTQPRRIAARSVAERIAQELDQPVGRSVGYAIRFDDRVSDTTTVKLMTDGILLAEMQHDPYLNAYDTIIIDEAHERSLNIDFLLGYLKRLLPKRPDLKVIITSATIDPDRFAAHFAEPDGTPAPVIEVSGRTYPVEIRYRPLVQLIGDKEVDQDPDDALIDALQELMAEGPGDILCFFPSERDIRDAMELIEKKRWRGVEVTPLFGRLSNQEQHKVFSTHSGRRIVLATNIAETSLTVPGIHYVVDTGTARISRYSTRSKVQRLPIEPISQASANQRSGRCGRIAEGICIRLYSEEDFLSRPTFTDPEILRTNLASVILQMSAMKLGDIAQFPFVQPPDHRAIKDGIVLLHELGAIDDAQETGTPVLTAIGRTLAKIPVDPRLARMLVEAKRYGVFPQIAVIVAAMTVQDIRERPLDFQAQADQLHARFQDKNSDFLTLLTLWNYLDEKRRQLSGRKLRSLMKEEFLHYMRYREWLDLVRQLYDVSHQLGWNVPDYQPGEIDSDGIHRSLLAGLLSHIGERVRDSKEFRGARDSTFWIFPGSALAKKPPAFVMAAELVETSRLWAREVAAINPQWVEGLAGKLLKRRYSEPYWSQQRAAAMVHEHATLYGVTVYHDRPVPYARTDQAAAREMFISHALVARDWDTHYPFLQHNSHTLRRAQDVEDKLRRRGIVADEDTLWAFYDARIPPEVNNGHSFDTWWKKQRTKDPHFLDMDLSSLIDGDSMPRIEEDFPTEKALGSVTVKLSYAFSPGSPNDGVTMHIPLPLLASIDTSTADWLVPGFREELLTHLIKSLPKELRRLAVPAPDFAAHTLRLLHPYQSPLVEQLADALRRVGVTGVSPESFDLSRIPDHLRMNFAAIDKRGKVVDQDRDFEALKSRQAGHIASSINKVATASTSKAVPRWTEDTLGRIPEETKTVVDGHTVLAYPALVLNAAGFTVKVLPTRQAADNQMRTTILAMLLGEVKVSTAQMVKGLPLTQRVAVDNYPHGGADGLVGDARIAAVRDALLKQSVSVRTPSEYRHLAQTILPSIPGQVRHLVLAIAPALVAHEKMVHELSDWSGEAIEDMQQQLKFMLPPNALTRHGIEHLRHIPRYVEAMQIRLNDLTENPQRDADLQDRISQLQTYLDKTLEKLPTSARSSRPVRDILWLLEELRVSLWAQRLGTTQTVSEKRIRKAIDKL